MILNPHHPRLLPLAAGGAINAIPVPLRRDDPSSPWCYAASLAPSIPLDDDDDDSNNDPTATSTQLPRGSNFLATQVWPSSRIASTIIEKHMDPSWTVCELGCGPGLPSLTAAKSGARRVIATDLDELALEMVRAAAIEQGFIENCSNDIVKDTGEKKQERFTTRRFDLTSQEHALPDADLYILSDVFESAAVAEGAAWHVQSILSNNRQKNNKENSGDVSRVWVFAQSDRAQRDSFLVRMREGYENDEREQLLDWTMDHAPDRDNELWLFDLDETMVEYN
mmetsp:Transcript_23039/g.49878  ORF Transcript_23039/g.49878 Transcript_23039/m.49878 type:complete len:281 (+) Transcript_23039:68-910(+)|eukprot:CAMPEP_0172317658 /NCGR_PEP_ID=MMETSP1058-20130122/32360_1 /TAXON_ID=83371 /ORGANISM="Detonula confervacea, Strain CCMP 353" /LENGTH=280 /DNA_ID=CAMNT_0013032275 /DNA_START=54 /DNA_END=896 /DNA_ORIENTATION=+